MKRSYAFILVAAIAMLILSVLPNSPAQALSIPQSSSTTYQSLTVSAVVGVNVLNLRRAPRTSSSVKGKLVRGEAITLIGRAEGGTWVQASTRFGIGWVAREFLIVGRTADLPIVSVLPPFLASGVTDGLKIRMGPSDSYPVIGKLNRGEEADVIAYFARPLWFQVVTSRGLVGWVYSASAQLYGILDNTPQAEGPILARIASYSVVVRVAPSLDAKPLGVVRLGKYFTIVGRDARGNWWQIKGNFGTGWVWANFTETVGDINKVPITDGSTPPLPVLD
jgi:uncharacterized protein YgiM (DUF1202 family)